jgi:negative regulator of sigma E activity
VGATAGIIALVVAGVGTAASIYEMTQQPKAPDAPTLPAAASQVDNTAQAAAQAQATAMSKRKGAASTLLTGPQGILTQPSTARQTLGA